MALILRYFTEFGSFRGALRRSGWRCRRKKFTFATSSPDEFFLFGLAFPASHLQHISDLHSKFTLGPHHVYKYGRHAICDRWDWARKKRKKEEERRRKKKQDKHIMSPSATTQGGHNKWSKNFDENPHRRGIFHLENLMWHSTASASSPSKDCHFPWGIWTHLIYSSSGPLESTSQTSTRSVQPYLQGSQSLQTDKRTDHATQSVAIGVKLVLRYGLIRGHM